MSSQILSRSANGDSEEDIEEFRKDFIQSIDNSINEKRKQYLEYEYKLLMAFRPQITVSLNPDTTLIKKYFNGDFSKAASYFGISPSSFIGPQLPSGFMNTGQNTKREVDIYSNDELAAETQMSIGKTRLSGITGKAAGEAESDEHGFTYY